MCVFSTSLQLVLFRTSSLLRPSATCPSPTTDDDGVRCGGGETGKNRWWTDVGGIGTERMHRVRGARGGAKGNTERERERAEEAAAWRESPVQRRRHAVCGATILIRRWIYGLNHRRIISDSRALLPPTETYACLFADNCIPVYLSPPLLYISSSLTFVLSTLRTHLPPLPSPSLRRDSILSRLDSGFRSPRGGGKRRRKRGRGREGGIGWHDDEKSNPSNG